MTENSTIKPQECWDVGIRDYVTLVKASHPINKKVCLINGSLEKKPSRHVSEASAYTVAIPNLYAFKSLLDEISENPNVYLILGYIPGTEDGELYRILSAKKMREKLGLDDVAGVPEGLIEIDGCLCATRSKTNFESSSIVVFDYDRVPGMPTQLMTSNQDIWLGWLTDLLPSLAGCSYLLSPSTTSRVLLDGNPAYSDFGWHMYVQVKDARDVERFGRELLIFSLGSKYGFLRPLYDSNTGNVIGHRPWLILDPTTFSPERALYEGRPIVSGKGLSVSDVSIQYTPGSRFDTSSLVLSETDAEKIRVSTGLAVERIKSNEYPGWGLVNRSDLNLSTPLETEKGVMTVEEYWLSNHGKLRAQAPFRPDSTSLAAFISRHSDGTPFVYDVGVQTKYLVNEQSVEQFKYNGLISWINRETVEVIKSDWASRTVELTPKNQELIRSAVQAKVGGTLRGLSSELQQERREHEKRREQLKLNEEKAARIAEGKTIVYWADDRFDEVVKEVRAAVISHKTAAPVFNYGGVVTTVRLGQPETVRQMLLQSQQGDDYPEHYVAFRHTTTTMEQRILGSVSFLKGKHFVGCPRKVATALLDDASFAPQLAGLLETPSVTPQGNFLNRPGYDPTTGYYMVFDKSLGYMPNRYNRTDALSAVKFIKDKVFSGFPFSSELDRDCALAFLITAFVRRFLAKAPGFMVTATTQASGKSTLVNTVYHAAFGRPAAASSWSTNQEEMAKHILAILMEGHSGVNFDNLPYGGRVDGDELAKLITEPLFGNRVLGSNTTAKMPTNILVSVTGNQLTAVNDMPSRLIPIALRPNTENPEETVYERPNIDEWHDSNRPGIVKAVCSILLAWHEHGKKTELTPSRFPDWDEVVRQPMVWLGLNDPSEAFKRNHSEDPVREARTALLEAWYEHFGSGWQDLKDIVPLFTSFDRSVSGLVSLSESLRELFDDYPDARHLGANFRYFKNNVFNGFRLEQQEKSGKSKASRPWRVVKLD